MTRKATRSSASELERTTGIDRHAIGPILAAAGIEPLKTAGGVSYPTAAAMRALAPYAGEATIIKAARDRAAKAKAAVMDIRVGLREGRYVTVAAHFERVDEQVSNFAVLRSVPGRHAHAVAAINASAATDQERRDRLRELFAKDFDHVLKTNGRLGTWQS